MPSLYFHVMRDGLFFEQLKAYEWRKPVLEVKGLGLFRPSVFQVLDEKLIILVAGRMRNRWRYIFLILHPVEKK